MHSRMDKLLRQDKHPLTLLKIRTRELICITSKVQAKGEGTRETKVVGASQAKVLQMATMGATEEEIRSTRLWAKATRFHSTNKDRVKSKEACQ